MVFNPKSIGIIDFNYSFYDKERDTRNVLIRYVRRSDSSIVKIECENISAKQFFTIMDTIIDDADKEG